MRLAVQASANAKALRNHRKTHNSLLLLSLVKSARSYMAVLQGA
jgi:hypothetical protein